MSETEKIKQLRSLDPEALSEIHSQYFPEIFRYALYRLGNPDLAEDIAGEVFVRFLEALHARRGPTKSLRGWLFGTASNLVNDIYRRSYGEDLTQLGEQPAMNGGDPLDFVARSEALHEIQVASAKLTDDQQHVLALRFGSGFSLDETADIMRKNPNAIKALQFRALNALRRHLGVDKE